MSEAPDLRLVHSQPKKTESSFAWALEVDKNMQFSHDDNTGEFSKWGGDPEFILNTSDGSFRSGNSVEYPAHPPGSNVDNTIMTFASKEEAAKWDDDMLTQFIKTLPMDPVDAEVDENVFENQEQEDTYSMLFVASPVKIPVIPVPRRSSLRAV